MSTRERLERVGSIRGLKAHRGYQPCGRHRTAVERFRWEEGVVPPHLTGDAVIDWKSPSRSSWPGERVPTITGYT